MSFFRKLMRGGILVVTLLICPLMAQDQSLRNEAPAYELYGRFYEERLSATGQVAFQNSINFTILVKQCAWLIRGEARSSFGTLKLREIGSVNEREIFDVFTPTTDVSFTNWSKSRSNTNQAVAKLHAQALISSNCVVAACNESEVSFSHLWLMFGSRCFFGSRTDREIPPVYDINTCVTRDKWLTQEADWILSETEPHLPLRITYMNTRGFYQGRDSNGGPHYVTLQSPFNEGFTNAIYTVTKTTNIGGLLLPLEFLFQRFEPANAGKEKDDLRTVESAFAIVTNVSAACNREDLIPTLPRNSAIIDRRLLHDSNRPLSVVTYSGGNGWVKDTEVVRKIARRQARRNYFSRLPRWLLPAFIAVVALPIGILFAREVIRFGRLKR